MAPTSLALFDLEHIFLADFQGFGSWLYGVLLLLLLSSSLPCLSPLSSVCAVRRILCA